MAGTVLGKRTRVESEGEQSRLPLLSRADLPLQHCRYEPQASVGRSRPERKKNKKLLLFH